MRCDDCCPRHFHVWSERSIGGVSTPSQLAGISLLNPEAGLLESEQLFCEVIICRFLVLTGDNYFFDCQTKKTVSLIATD
jgi:hypothetical protein